MLPSYIKLESDNPTKFKLILQKLFLKIPFILGMNIVMWCSGRPNIGHHYLERLFAAIIFDIIMTISTTQYILRYYYIIHNYTTLKKYCNPIKI